MSRLTNEQLRRVVEALVKAANPIRVILFGSQARGEAVRESDLDLLVIEDGPFEQQPQRRHEEMVRLRRAIPPDVPGGVDVLVFDQQEERYWREAPNHVIARAWREGKVLHERG